MCDLFFIFADVLAIRSEYGPSVIQRMLLRYVMLMFHIIHSMNGCLAELE